jgi:hypothetical protein
MSPTDASRIDFGLILVRREILAEFVAGISPGFVGLVATIRLRTNIQYGSFFANRRRLAGFHRSDLIAASSTASR